MIWIEWCKVWKKASFLKLLMIMLLLTLGLKFYQVENTEAYMPSAYVKLADDLQGRSEKEIDKFFKEAIERSEALQLISESGNDEITNEEMIKLIKKYQDAYQNKQYPRYENSYENESKFLNEMYTEFKEKSHYPMLRKEIDEQADKLQSITLFHNDDDSMAFILRTAKDYKKLAIKTLDYHVNKGFQVAFMDSVPFIMILIMLFPLVYLLFFEENETGLLYLMKSTPKGRFHTISAKLKALLLSIALLVILFYGVSMLFAMRYYPSIQWSEAIQTLSGFTRSTLSVSIASYLLIFLVIKWLMCSFLAIVFAYLLQKSQNYILSILIVLTTLILEYAAYTLLLSTGSLSFFKYVNIYTWLDVHILFSKYYNVLIMHHILSLRMISTMIVGVLTIIFLYLNIHFYLNHKEVYHKKQRNIKWRKQKSHSLLFYNIYKVLWSQKTLFIFLCFFTIANQRVEMHSLTSMQLYEKSYIEDVENLSLKECDQYFKSQSDYFTELEQHKKEVIQQQNDGLIGKVEADTLIYTLDLQTRPYPAFVNVKEKYEKIKAHPEQTLLYEEGYRQLFSNQDELLIICMFFVIMLFVPATIFMDKHKSIQLLLDATPLGKKKQKQIQWQMSLFVSILLVTLICMKQLYVIGSTHGFNHVFARLSSLELYEKVSFPISIVSFYIIGYLLRIYIVSAFAYCIYTLSMWIHKVTHVYLLAFLLLFGGVCLNVLKLNVAGLDILMLFQLPYQKSFSIWLLYPLLLIVICKMLNKKRMFINKN